MFGLIKKTSDFSVNDNSTGRKCKFLKKFKEFVIKFKRLLKK